VGRSDVGKGTQDHAKKKAKDMLFKLVCLPQIGYVVYILCSIVVGIVFKIKEENHRQKFVKIGLNMGYLSFLSLFLVLIVVYLRLFISRPSKQNIPVKLDS
jgi:uncharacterized membrane protein YagU involved in acid resistance